MTTQQQPAELKKDLSTKTTTIQMIETLLKDPGTWFEQITKGQTGGSLWIFAFIFLVCNLGYSLIVGSFSGNSQWLAAPLKIILGTIVSALLCYPSLFIFACLAGANIDPKKTIALLTSSMTLTAILLIGFAPVAFVFTFGINSLFFMGMIHFLAWGISIYFGLRHIHNGLSKMSCQNIKLIKVWGLIVVITMLQMSTTLRPIIGESDHFLTDEKRFFVEHWLDNVSDNSRN